MPKMKLTAAAVERLRPPDKGRVEYFDVALPSFALRISDSGAKSWVLMYRMGGRTAKLRRFTIGRYPALSLAEARDRAKAAMRLVERNIDPADARAEARAEAQERAANTVAAIAREFVEDHARKKRSGAKMHRMLEREVVPAWGDRPVDTITRRDVLELLRGIHRRAPYMSNRVLEVVRLMFNWATVNDYVPANPTAGVRPLHDEKSRARILDDDEVVALWGAFGDLGYPFGPMFRLLMVTAQRRDEVATMRRGEVDLKKRLWTLPAERTKADRIHEVPLSDAAVGIIEGLPHFVGGNFMFSTTGGDRPSSGFSRAKARADRLVAAAAEKAKAEGREPVEVAPWRLHDLRRTAASGMARLGVAPHVLARVLNHSPGSAQGVTAIYNRHGYDTEKRHALDLWARHLEGLLKPLPAKVVPLRRGARRESA